MNNDRKDKSLPSRFFIGYIGATAMICGALIMVVEILGSRVIGPLFGVSLFVWTALITVTLVALAMGYALGGLLADRRGTPEYLYLIIFLAGVLVCIIPAVRGIVLRSCLPLGLRSGALLSSMVLFGPSLFLLGCVSPYIVKIVARELGNIGRTVGIFYAISTLGSFLGTVLAGFFLIAFFGVNMVFLFVGLLLMLLSVLYFTFFRNKWFAILCLVLLATPCLLRHGEPLSLVMEDGMKVSVIFDKDTFYGNLKVVDYSKGQHHSREMQIDGQIQGGIDMSNGLSLYEFTYLPCHIPYGKNPDGEDCLVIGLGAGIIPMWYEKKGIATDVVDVNPLIPDVAGNYFGFSLSGDIFIADARRYLYGTRKKYDYVVLDVFNGDTTPGHLLSVEAFELVSSRMTKKGILAINLAGSLKQDTFMTASVLKTLKVVFDRVECYPLFHPEEEADWGNMSVIAYNDPAAAEEERSINIDYRDIHPEVYPAVKEHLNRKFVFPPGTKAIVLTDDYNPIDFYDIRLKENCRKTILERGEHDILI